MYNAIFLLLPIKNYNIKLDYNYFILEVYYLFFIHKMKCIISRYISYLCHLFLVFIQIKGEVIISIFILNYI